MNINSIIPIRNLLVSSSRSLTRAIPHHRRSFHHHFPVRQNQQHEQPKPINVTSIHSKENQFITGAKDYSFALAIIAAVFGALYLFGQTVSESNNLKEYYTTAINKSFESRRSIEVSDEQIINAATYLLEIFEGRAGFGYYAPLPLFHNGHLIKRFAVDISRDSVTFVDSSGNSQGTFPINHNDMQNLFNPYYRDRTAEKIVNELEIFMKTSNWTYKSHILLEACSQHRQTKFVQELFRKHSIIFITSDFQTGQIKVKYSPKVPDTQIDATTKNFMEELHSILCTLSTLDIKLSKNQPLKNEGAFYQDELQKNPLLKDAAEIFFPEVKKYFDSLA